MTSFRGIIGTATAVAGATVVAAAMSGGSYALWSDGTTVSAGTVSSGSIGLSVAETFVPSQWSNLVVGDSVRQSFTATNNGTVPLTLSGSATSATGYEIRLASGACGVALTGTAASAQATSLGALAAGATKTICLEVKVVAGAAAGSSSAFVTTITGAQS
jgi:hypothetical protein